MAFKEFIKNVFQHESEIDLAKTIFVSLLTSFIILLSLYVFGLRFIPEFSQKYGFYLFFLILSYSIILPSVKYIRSYGELPCMSGMMVGMTIGMISGFLPGFYVASTNGMFWGSIFGMALGISFGIWNGKCCGVMGVMEGTMAGFMGGLMGAMTSVMMFNDHLKAAGVIVFIISAFIIIGLNFMIYKETRGAERKHIDDDFFTIFWSILLTTLTIIVVVFGPRSVLLQ